MAETDAEKMVRLEKDVADARQQLSGLSNERNAYRQKAEAWEKVGGECGDRVVLDPTTGLPTGVRGAVPAAVAAGAHPLAFLTGYQADFNPSAIDAHFANVFKAQGFLTADQAQQWAGQAAQQGYQAARGDFMVMRNYDKLTSQERYKDLANPDSELGKRTSRILQERKLAEPLNGAKTLDGWRYANLEALQMGADLARLELHEEGLKNAAAGAAGQAAGMASGGAPQAGTAQDAEKWEAAVASGDVNSMKEMIGSHLGATATP